MRVGLGPDSEILILYGCLRNSVESVEGNHEGCALLKGLRIVRDAKCRWYGYDLQMEEWCHYLTPRPPVVTVS